MAAIFSSRRKSSTARITSVLTAFILVALMPTGSANADIIPWNQGKNAEALITGPMRLILVFADQSGVPRSALVQSLPPSALNGMPGGLETAAASPLFRPAYFDALWSAMRSSVCTDVQNEIVHNLNNPPNSAYDPQPCAMGPRGALVASFQTQWEDDQYRQVTGRRLVLHYIVPINGVTFWMTSPHTCNRHGPCSGFQPTDPQYTVIFEVDITVTCAPSPYANINTFSMPIVCTPAASVLRQDVEGGDVTGQLKTAAAAWAASLPGQIAGVAAGGAGVVSLIASTAGVAVEGIGTAISDSDTKHLRDQVSAGLSTMGSGTVNANAANISADFQNMFQSLYFAQLGGFRGFAVGVTTTKPYSLDFGLVYPPPAKPVVQNTIASANKGSIFSPTIAVAQPEVQPGDTVTVTADYFRGVYANALTIGCNKTVIGTPSTQVAWGPPPQVNQTSDLTFVASNLTPSTSYNFRVHECDGLTCAPWSDVLTTATQAAGSGQVRFWLDSNTSQPIGASMIGASANSFTADVTIPDTTPSGPHMLHAAAPGQSMASAPITICQTSGCQATVALVNTSNNTLYPPGENVEVSLPVTLRCQRFTYPGTVTIYVDAIAGPRAAMASVNPGGTFDVTFNMPAVPPGPHKFLAIEGNPIVLVPIGGHPPPHRPVLQASVAVYVQALAQ